MQNLTINLYGSYYLLSVCPVWTSMPIYLLLYYLLWFIRRHFEGRGYDVAYSSKFGMPALVTFVILAAWIIQQPDFQPSALIESKIFHLIIIGATVVTTIIYFLITRPKQWGDRWHALVMFPTLLYFVATSIPVYWKYIQLTSINNEFNPFIVSIGFCFLLLWVFLVIDDIKNKRMNQREWISIHHTNWKFKN